MDWAGDGVLQIEAVGGVRAGNTSGDFRDLPDTGPTRGESGNRAVLAGSRRREPEPHAAPFQGAAWGHG